MEHVDAAMERLTVTVRDDVLVNYAFEIQFLVARERPDIDYSNADDDCSDVSDNDLADLRWACPPDEEDPYGAILDRCKDLLVQNDEPVVICHEMDYNTNLASRFNTDAAGESDRFGSWNLGPCNSARAKRGSPPDYDWLGVSLRSPLYPESTLNDPESNLKLVLTAMRMGLTMHVNSTCQFNVHVEPDDRSMTLLDAKKLATLVWLLEKEMLLRLCPNSQGVPFGHVRPIDSSSRIAAALWKGDLEGTRPNDPLRAGIMDQHLPPLHDKFIQERLHGVWGAATLQELSKSLHCTDGTLSSFSIHIYDNDPDSEVDPPTAEFRYALWHPYRDLDASDFWIQLAINMYKATGYESFRFREYVKLIDRTIKDFSLGVQLSSRWKILLNKLQLSEDWSAPWEKIVDEYREGRRLGYRMIDRQVMTDPMEDVRGYNGR